MDFNRIIGHEIIKKGLENSIIKDKFSHAHLFVGEDGIGKSLLAKEFAMGILNKETTRNSVDIVEWRVLKGKKSIGINEIRELNIEVNKKPYEGNRKVIIIYNADKMTKEAQNAFLKTIEEPPKGVVIILLSNSLEAILHTIKSRCQLHKLNRLSSQEIKKYLDTYYKDLGDEDKRVLINFCDGIPGRIDEFMKDEVFINIRDNCLKIILTLMNDKSNLLKVANTFLEKNKEKWNDVLNIFLAYFRDIIIYKEARNSDLILNYDKIDDIKRLADSISYKNLNKFVDIINETRERLESRVNSALVFEVMLYKLQEV